MGSKTNPKTEPETGPLKKLRSSETEIPCSKKGTKMVPQKGVPCETLASSMLCYCFLLDFLAFRAYFGRYFVPTSELWAFISLCFLGSGFRISELTKLIPYTHISQPYSFSIKVALCGLVGMREAGGILKTRHVEKEGAVCLEGFSITWGFCRL